MSDITNRDSIVQVQRAATVRRRSTVKRDAEEFQNRHGELAWQDDSQITRCTGCKTKFTLTNRKHHCRECGKVFCGKCASYNVVVNATLKRACEQCYKEATKRSINDSSVVFKNPEVPVMYTRGDSIGRMSEASDISKGTAPTATSSSNASNNTSTLASALAAMTGSSTTSTTPAASSTANGENVLPHWIEGVVFIRKYFSDNEPMIKVVSPQDHSFSAEMLEDIFTTSLPPAQRGNGLSNTDGSKEQKFMFRIRDKSLPGAVFKDENEEIIGTAVNKSTLFYNCYVYFKQQTTPPPDVIQNQQKASSAANSPTNTPLGSTRSLDKYTFRQAIVLISKWPYPQLAYRLLEKLDEALYFHAASAKENNKERAHSDESVESVSRTSEGWKEFDIKSPGSVGNTSNSPATTPTNVGTPASIAFATIPPSGENNGNNADAIYDLTEAVVKAVFTIAIGQIDLWPVPAPGIIVYLSFFGEMLHHTMPSTAEIFNTYTAGGNISFHIGLNGINLVSLFGPLGLIQHLWTIWEILVTGQDLVVIAPTPSQASEIVLAIASLVLPYAQLGDIRPYICSDDSDIDVLAATAVLKHSQLDGVNSQIQDTTSKIAARNKSMIVGICDPTILGRLEEFTSALLIATPSSNLKNTNLTDSDMIFKGLRTKNAADFHMIRSSTLFTYGNNEVKVRSAPGGGLAVPGRKKKSILASTLSLTTSALTLSSPSSTAKNDSFSNAFQYWIDKENMRRSAILTHQEPSAFMITRIVNKLKKLHPDDRAVLGDQLLRDHLKEITLGFFAPSVAGNLVAADGIRLSNAATEAELEELKKDIRLDQRNQQLLKAAESKGMIALALVEFLTYIQLSPALILDNIPLMMMWIAYALLLIALGIVGVPPLFLIIGVFVIKLPDKVPLWFELILRGIIPSFILYPNQSATEGGSVTSTPVGGSPAVATSTVSATESEKPAKDFKPFNLSGVWKRVRIENYENFLAAQGASYVQKKLACSISMIHTITMDDECTVARIQEKGGPIDTDNEYVIGGESKETLTIKNVFLDTVTWSSDGRLLVKKLKLPEKGYELWVYRSLENNGKTIKLEGVYHDLKGGKDVHSFCYFDYIGPSPNSIPASVGGGKQLDRAEKGEGKAAIGASTPGKKVAKKKATRPDFSGVWNRTKSHNFEAYVGAAGGGFMQRKLAASMQLAHTITMDPPALQAFRLQEKGGPLNTDMTLTIGADFVDFDLNGKKFVQRMYWIDDALVNQRRSVDNTFELIMTRTLDLESNLETPQIILKLTHRDLSTGKETDATSWFSKTGDSPNPPPVADVASIIEKDEEDGRTGSVVGLNENDGDEDENIDNDEDDDEVAVAKMRSISTAQKSAFKSKLEKKSTATRKSFFSTSFFSTGNKKKGSISPKRTSLSAVKEAEDDDEEEDEPVSPLKSVLSAPFNGTWVKTTAMNQTPRKGADATAMIDSQTTVTHKISIQNNTLKYEEIGGNGEPELNLTINSSDFITGKYHGKKVKSRAYFEGNVLVLHRIFQSEKYETFDKRELEENGNVIRLTTIRKNATSGVESESMTLFRKQ